MTSDSATPTVGDAFGETLLRCATDVGRPGSVYNVTERDDGFVAITEAKYWFTRPEDWPAHERWAIGEVRGRVLDVGCGSGRHAITLAEKGFDVIGLDTSPGAIEVAQGNGVRVIHNDLMALRDVGTFDSILMLGYNLGLLRDHHYAPRILAHLAGLTSAGGRIIGSCVDPSMTEIPDHLSYHRRNERLGRMPGQQRIRSRYRSLATPWFDYLYMSPRELAGLTAGSTWTLGSVERDKPGYAAVLNLNIR